MIILNVCLSLKFSGRYIRTHSIAIVTAILTGSIPALLSNNGTLNMPFPKFSCRNIAWQQVSVEAMSLCVKIGNSISTL